MKIESIASQTILVIRTFCRSNSAATVAESNGTDRVEPDHPVPNLSHLLLEPESLPLWCDLAILPEIPMHSSDKSDRHVTHAAMYLGQQEFNSCGQDNVILLQDLPSLSKSGGYLMSLSSCQTKFSLSETPDEEIFLPINAIPSTFLLQMDSVHDIVQDESLYHSFIPMGGDDATELEVIFDFSEAVSVVGGIFTTRKENVTLHEDKGKGTDDACAFDSSDSKYFMKEEALSDKHEQLLSLLKTLAEEEARAFDQTLYGLAVLALVLIAGYVWLSFSLLQRKRRPRDGRRRTLALPHRIGMDKVTPPMTIYTNGKASGAEQNKLENVRVTEHASVEKSATVAASVVCVLPSFRHVSATNHVTLVQAFFRKKIACVRVTQKLALVLQLQSIFRGRNVRRRLLSADDKSVATKEENLISIQASHNNLDGGHQEDVMIPRCNRMTTFDYDLSPPVHSITVDHSKVSLNESSQEEVVADDPVGNAEVDAEQNDSHVATFVAVKRRTKMVTRGGHSLVSDERSLSTEPLSSDFAGELKAMLRSRLMKSKGGRTSIHRTA